MLLKKKKMNKLLIIDGNNLAHRAYHKFNKFKSSKGKSTSVIYGFTYILRSLISKLRPNNVLVVFDGGRDKERLRILPSYKDRDKKSDFDYKDFTSQKEVTKSILDALGIQHVTVPKKEADDIMWLYGRRYIRNGGSIIIASTDKDFNQLLNSYVSIWHPWKNKRITHKNLKTIYGYSPEECVDWLSLVGDKSDKVPGLSGVGEKTARKFLDEYGSILNYIKTDVPESSSKILTKKNVEESFLLNRQLVDIKLHCRRHLKNIVKIEFTKGKINKKELAFICSKYTIAAFTQESFIKTFKF